MELQYKIEGLLFYKGEPVSVFKLAELLDASVSDIEESLVKLEESLAMRGIILMKKDNSVMLAVASDLSALIEKIRKEEITKELSKATLETLSIVMYKNGPGQNGITRNEIDYIRGVNSSFILRNLLIRGLIEKEQDKNDNRRNVYKPTFDTLSYMGITSIEELPDYAKTVAELNNTIKEQEMNHE